MSITLRRLDVDSPASTAQAVQMVEEVSSWLQGVTAEQEMAEEALTWHLRWRRSGVAVRSPEHLAVLVSVLNDEAFGGIAGPVAGRWAQVMRVSARWLVEVRHESSDWPDRVFRGGQEDWPGRLGGDGQPWATELFSSMEVADIMWSWMRTGTLPTGISRTADYLHSES